MNKKLRKKIIREANRRIRDDNKNFNNLKGGKKEQIQDKYIDVVSKENGWSLKDFYATNGKELNELLNSF